LSKPKQEASFYRYYHIAIGIPNKIQLSHININKESLCLCQLLHYCRTLLALATKNIVLLLCSQKKRMEIMMNMWLHSKS